MLSSEVRPSPDGVPGALAGKVDVYEDAGHAFFADYRPTYRPAAAAQLWERVVPFLQRHLNREA